MNSHPDFPIGSRVSTASSDLGTVTGWNDPYVEVRSDNGYEDGWYPSSLMLLPAPQPPEPLAAQLADQVNALGARLARTEQALADAEALISKMRDLLA